MAAEPHFADADARTDDADAAAAPAARFCIFHPPAGGSARGHVLHVHAFAEEMNKSRRMAALQSRALAAAGYAVLQFDLLGCGDSAGDFGDATWQAWLGDVRWGARHLRRRAGGAGAPLWLWGHRVGALLAVQAAAAVADDAGAAPNLLLWQPVIAGRTALQQFLRLKAAGELLDGGGKGVTDALKRELAAGRDVDVAGYRICAALAAGLDAATLAPPPPPAHAVWLEVAGSDPAELSPAGRGAVARWRDAGWRVDAAAVVGPAFWQTTEIEDAPALVERATESLLAATAAADAAPTAGAR